MDDLKLVMAAGLFSLGGVVVGALLTPLTQIYLESNREKRAANRAKLLVAGELLHAQLVLRAAAQSEIWPYMEDAVGALAYLPSSAWEENRSSLVGQVDEDLMNQLVMAYVALEIDRDRFVVASKIPDRHVTPDEAQSLKDASKNLGRLRRQLGGGGGWLDEIQDEFNPRVASLNDDFKRWLDGLSDERIQQDSVIGRVKAIAHDLGELNRTLGDEGAWAAEIDSEIDRRLR